MDPAAAAYVKIFVPKVPFILKTIAWHSLWMSPTSSTWDLRTELTVRVLREILTNGPPTTVTKAQRGSLRDPGIKGKVWVSKLTLPAPQEDDLRQLLFQVIDDLKEEDLTYTQPLSQPLEVEWTGYRAGATATSAELKISEEAKYTEMMKDVKGPSTLLYFHGGAYYLLDPAMYRQFASKVTKINGGRVFNVRYRLAPQNPFPAALLDALNSYLALLYPPTGSPHEPVRAQDITFGGDSAGGNLASVLLVTILALHQKSPGTIPTVMFNGKKVEIPLPGGLALISPWLDLTRCLPSVEGNVDTDYVPPPSLEKLSRGLQPTCDMWPAKPARIHLYCDGNAMSHPLVSPLMHKNWKGCPPTYFVLGEEMLEDEDMITAQRIARQGSTVILDYFQKMPHVHHMILETRPESKKSIENLAKFCQNVAESPSELKSEASSYTPKTCVRSPLDVTNLKDWKDEDVYQLVRDTQKTQISTWQERQKVAQSSKL